MQRSKLGQLDSGRGASTMSTLKRRGMGGSTKDSATGRNGRFSATDNSMGIKDNRKDGKKRFKGNGFDEDLDEFSNASYLE